MKPCSLERYKQYPVTGAASISSSCHISCAKGLTTANYLGENLKVVCSSYHSTFGVFRALSPQEKAAIIKTLQHKYFQRHEHPSFSYQSIE